MHGDMHKYPLVALQIKFQGKTHRVKAAVLGTDWPGFKNLLEQCVGMHLQPVSHTKRTVQMTGHSNCSDQRLPPTD